MKFRKFRSKVAVALASLLLVSHAAPLVNVYGQEAPQEPEIVQEVDEENFETQQTEGAYPLGLEIRGLDGRRTTEVGISVVDSEGVTITGSFNDYGQWLTEALAYGTYFVTLTPSEGTNSQINPTAPQNAVALETPNTYQITIDEETIGNNSAVYGAFQLVEDTTPEPATFALGVEVRGLDDYRTDEVGIAVSSLEGTQFTGTYNEYLQWRTDEALPEGTYFIALDTPDGTVSEINETTQQFAVPTDTDNLYTIELNEDNLGSSSAIYGAFRLVEDDIEEATYRLGVEVRGLEGTRTNEVGVRVSNGDNVEFAGSYNQYYQWLTEEELPAGTYFIELTPPEGTVSEINETTQQFAVPTDTENLYTIELNEDNLGSSSAIYGAFRLVEDDDNGEPIPEPDTFRLGVEVRNLNDQRTDSVSVKVTNSAGEQFAGSYNEYLQWLSEEELPEGTYTIRLTPPAGTVSRINDTTNQYAQATNQRNVYTIELNDANLGSSSAIYGAFRLVEDDDNGEPIPDPDTYRLGIEVRDLQDRRTDKVEVIVLDNEGNRYEGTYNDYLQWISNSELPEGTYIIKLKTPEGTLAKINDTTQQYAKATDRANVFTIELNDANLGNSSAVYGAFKLVRKDDGQVPGKPEKPEPELPATGEARPNNNLLSVISVALLTGGSLLIYFRKSA